MIYLSKGYRILGYYKDRFDKNNVSHWNVGFISHWFYKDFDKAMEECLRRRENTPDGQWFVVKTWRNSYDEVTE